MTPAAVHYGRAEELHTDRARVLTDAYRRTPERFVRRPPRPPALPTATWINKPTSHPPKRFKMETQLHQFSA